ncbi:MAG: hypothetical protein GC172_11635 [Phycisphaera sp.]|nr:hypothetical protein [Phycisphaera sp.]
MQRLATAARALAIASALASLGVLVLVGFAIAASLDALLRFPMPVRALLLVAIALLAAVDLKRFVLPALRFRPRSVELALRVERARPELAGRLASAVEFEESGIARRNPLAARAVADLEERARGMDLRGVLRVRPTVTRVGAALALVVAGALFATADSQSASIAVRRIFLPWTDASWPARTAVEALIASDAVLPRGKPVALRARLTKGDVLRERVFARYRIWPADGSTGIEPAWNEVALSRQPSGDFERLVDADGSRIEVVFLTSDAETEPLSVRLVDPPRVVRAVATVTPPAYARRILGARTEDLGDGRDARGTPRGSILSKSEVVIDFELSRELPLAETASSFLATGVAVPSEPGSAEQDAARGVDAGAQAMADAGTDAGAIALVPSRDPADPRRWSLRFLLEDAARIEVDLVDLDGIRQTDPCVFAFDAVDDRPPSAALVEPMQDESVLPDARIPLRAEGRDDIELRAAGIEIAMRVGGGPTETMQFEERADISEEGASSSLERTLDVARLSPKPGDALVLRAFSEDHLVGSSVDGALRERTRSAQRVLRIVTEDEFERQLRSTLASTRREAMRIDERQARARESTEGEELDPGLAAAQGAVTEGVARMRESVEEIRRRIERNRQGDGSLAEIVRQAEELASVAEARSADASEAVQRLERAVADAAGSRESGDAGEGMEAEASAEEADLRNEVARRQDEVRAELEDLVALLDRDEDAWIARRKLESLASEVQRLAREAGQAAQRSSGESREELSPDARAELDDLSSRMNRAADEVEKTVSDLRERAELLKESDSAQAEGLEAAARETEDGRVREQVDRAAEEAAQNRLEQSRGSLEQASEALARALAAMEEDRKVRARELARMMEELVDSIKRLLGEAEMRGAELERVPSDDNEQARAARDPLAVAHGAISQNTRGVAADARTRSRESARAARLLETAATSLGAVASRLRSEKFVQADAVGASDAAIRALEDALAEAERLAERANERAEEERREELVAKYRVILERQVAVRSLVERVVPDEPRDLTRRETVESRRLSTVQEQIRSDVAGILEAEQELRDAEVLVEMHDVIDMALSDARDRLVAGQPQEALPPTLEAIDAISAIVGALDDGAAGADEDRFGEQEAGEGQSDGGSSGAPSGAVPPAAEVRLLMSMQEALARRTRTLDEQSEGLDEAARAGVVAELAARQRRILDLGLRLADKIRGQGQAQPRVDPAGDGADEDADTPGGGGAGEGREDEGREEGGETGEGGDGRRSGAGDTTDAIRRLGRALSGHSAWRVGALPETFGSGETAGLRLTVSSRPLGAAPAVGMRKRFGESL